MPIDVDVRDMVPYQEYMTLGERSAGVIDGVAPPSPSASEGRDGGPGGIRARENARGSLRSYWFPSRARRSCICSGVGTPAEASAVVGVGSGR